MSKIVELRKSVRTILLTACSKCYYGQADLTAGFPYCVYSIEEVQTMDGVTSCELDVTICGYGKETSTIENLCDAINTKLDHLFKDEDSIAYTCYFSKKNNVASDDSNIIRRRMLFDINLYVKENNQE